MHGMNIKLNIFLCYGEKKLNSYLQYWASWWSSNAPELYWEGAQLEFVTPAIHANIFHGQPKSHKENSDPHHEYFSDYQMMDSIHQITVTKCSVQSPETMGKEET
jgi:hypothetical protein